MEVAGVALGAIPIAIWALEKYQEPLTAYCDYDMTIRMLKADLEVQKQLLDQTLEGIGLHDTSREEAKERLKVKFPRLHEDLLVIISHMNDLTFKLLKKLKVDISRKPNWKDESSSWASWEWRRVERSFGIKKQRTIIDELRNRNFDLRVLVEKPEVPTADVGCDGYEDDGNSRAQRIHVVQRTYDPLTCDAVRHKARSLHRTIQAGIKECGGDPHEAAIELHWGVAPKFTVSLLHGDGSDQDNAWKCFYASGAEYRQPSSGRRTESLAVTSPPQQPRSPSPGRLGMKAILDRVIRRTGIKSVSLNMPEITVQEGEQAPTVIVTSSVATTATAVACPEITNLCTEVPSPPNVSDPFAIIRDPHASESTQSFSLSYASTGRPSILRPVYLKESAGHDRWHADGFLSLSAGKRYALAAAVAKGVLYLSNSPWLEHGWIPDQIRLFLRVDSSSGQEVLSDHAHIYHAFNHSIPTAHSSRSWPPAKTPLIPDMKIFALGIFLIELGANEPFQDSSLDAILQGDGLGLRRKLEKVHSEAGKWYGWAAQRCIYCEFMGDRSKVDLKHPAFQREFYNAVVAPLQATADATLDMF